MAQSGSNNDKGAHTGGWFTLGFSKLSNIFGNGSSENQQRKRTLDQSLNGSVAHTSDATPSQPSPRALSLSGVKRVRRTEDADTSDILLPVKLNSSVRDSVRDSIDQPSLNASNRSLIDLPPRRSILDFSNTSYTPSQRKPTRAKQILDILDKIETSATSTTDDSLNFSKTQKWLEDINVIKATPPPRKSLRTPTRLSSIIASSRPKPSWQRIHSNQTISEKPTETSFEEQEDPGDVSPLPTSSKKPVKDTPYFMGSRSESHRGESHTLKNSSGRNVLRATDDVFEVDTSDRATMEQLSSVKPPATAPPPSAYRLKSRSFNFTLPVFRGPHAIIETVTEEPISADSALNSDDDALSEESRVSTPDKIVEGNKTPKLNSETSSSVASDGTSDADQTITPPKSVETPKTSSKWECPTCMTENTVDACECCDTPRPKPWTCDTCFVENSASEKTCSCCGSAPPGSAPSNAAAPAAPAFKPQDFTKKPASGGVKFGLAASSTAPALPSDSSKSTGIGSSNSSTSATAPFVFGIKPAEPTPSATLEPATKPVSFGLPSATSTTPAASTESASTPVAPSLFGSKLPTSGSLFGTSDTTTSNAGSALFGNSAVSNTGSSLFGAPATTNTGAPASTLLAPPVTTTASTGLFGSTTTGSAPNSSLFGAPASTTSASTGLFGSTPTAAPPVTTAAPLLFGTTAAPASAPAPSLFGSTLGSTQPSFGAVATTQPSFGATSTTQPSFGTAATTQPSFGSASATQPLFGAPSSSSNLFAATPSNEAPKSNGFNFGAPSASTPAFGALNGNAAASSVFSGFSNANAANGDAPAEKRANTFGSQPAAGGFGSAATGFNANINANGFNFGSTATAAAPPASFAFGAPPQAPSSGAFQFGGAASAAPQAPIQFGGAAPGQAPMPFGGAAPAANAFMPPSSSNRRILSARRTNRKH